MKTLAAIFTTFISSTGFSAAPCNGNLEAEFIAQYNHIDFSYAEVGNAEHTTYDLKNFRFYNENQICPLRIDLAEQATLTEYRILISIETGSEVSGVLVYNPKTQQFFIEK